MFFSSSIKRHFLGKKGFKPLRNVLLSKEIHLAVM